MALNNKKKCLHWFTTAIRSVWKGDIIIIREKEVVAKYPRAVINGNSVITKMVVEVQLPGLKTWGDDADGRDDEWYLLPSVLPHSTRWWMRLLLHTDMTASHSQLLPVCWLHAHDVNLHPPYSLQTKRLTLTVLNVYSLKSCFGNLCGTLGKPLLYIVCASREKESF